MERGAQDVMHLHSVHRRVNVVRGGANHEWQLMCQLLFMTGLTNSALFVGFRPMLTPEPEAVPAPAYRTVLYSTVRYAGIGTASRSDVSMGLNPTNRALFVKPVMNSN